MIQYFIDITKRIIIGTVVLSLALADLSCPQKACALAPAVGQQGTYRLVMDEIEHRSLHHGESGLDHVGEGSPESRREGRLDIVDGVRRRVVRECPNLPPRAIRLRAKLLLRLEPVARAFTQATFLSSREERIFYDNITGLLSDSLGDCLKTSQQAERSSYRQAKREFDEDVKSASLLLSNIALKRTYEHAVLGGSPEKTAYLRSKGFEDHMVWLAKAIGDLGLAGYDAHAVQAASSMVEASLGGMVASIRSEKERLASRAHDVREAAVVDRFLDSLVGDLIHLTFRRKKTEDACAQVLEPYSKDARRIRAFIESEALASDDKDDAKGASSSGGSAGGSLPYGGGGFRMGMGMLQRAELTQEQRMEQKLAQVAVMMVEMDVEAEERVASGVALSDDELADIVAELREHVRSTFEGYQEVLGEKQAKLFDVDKMTDAVIDDFKRRAAIRLSKAPPVSDITTSRMADLAKYHIRLTKPGNLFFARRDGSKCLTYDLLHLLKYFSLAPMFFRPERAGAPSADIVALRMIQALSPKQVNDMITADSGQFVAAATEVVDWIEKGWTSRSRKAQVEIFGTPYSRQAYERIVASLRSLIADAQRVASADQSDVRSRARIYTLLYRDIVRLTLRVAEDAMKSHRIWTNMPDDRQDLLYRHLKMLRTKGAVSWIGPRLKDIRQNEFVRVGFIEIPSSELVPGGAQIVSVNGDFHSWMAEEAIRSAAYARGVAVTDEACQRALDSVTVTNAYAFRVGTTRKLLVLGEKGLSGASVAKMTEAFGRFGERIYKRDIVYAGGELMEREDDAEPAEETPEGASREAAPAVPLVPGGEVLAQFQSMICSMIDAKAPPVIVCDMDGTITPPHGIMSAENAKAIIRILERGLPFAVLTGGSRADIEKQFLKPLRAALPAERKGLLKNLILAPASGTQIYRYEEASDKFVCFLGLDIKEEFGLGQKRYDRVFEIVNECMEEKGARGMLRDVMGMEFAGDAAWAEFKKSCFEEKKIKDMEGKVSAITFRVIGTDADNATKARFENKGGRQIREVYAEYINKKFMEEGIDLIAKVSGQSAIDLTPKGIDKGFGVAALATAFAADTDRIVFFGDAFKPGNNDEPALKAARRAVNVGPKTAIYRSEYYREDKIFFEIPDSGADGFRLFMERFLAEYERRDEVERKRLQAIKDEQDRKDAAFRSEMEKAETSIGMMREMMAAKAPGEKLVIRIWSGFAKTAEQKALLQKIRDTAPERGYDIDFGFISSDAGSLEMLAKFAVSPEGKKPGTVTVLPSDRRFDVDVRKYVDLMELVHCPVIFIDPHDYSDEDDFTHIEGILALAVAYVNNDRESFTRLCNLLCERPYSDKPYPADTLEQLKKYAYMYILRLQPMTVKDASELKRINDRIREFLVAA